MLKGQLKPPRPPGNPGEFDYPAYLANRDIYYTLTVKQDHDLKLISRESGVLKIIDSFRAKGEKLIQQTLPPHEAAILSGMLLGTREGINEEQYSDFQKTGIVHLFSVSGLHVGFLLLLITWITSLLNMRDRSRFITGVAVLLVYGTMVAWPECVIRAVLMGILGLLAYYSGRENSMMNALAISGLVIILINPNSLFNISFQLTMLATWGLVYLFPLMRKKLPWHGKVWDLILLPISAELAVLPLIAYYFNIITPVSIITNVLVSYLSGAVVILGFVALFLAVFVPVLAAVILYPAGMMVEIIIYIVKITIQIPGGFIWVATPPVILIALYYAGLQLGIYTLGKTELRRWSAPAFILMGAFFVAIFIPGSFYHKGYLEASFIDVGQGDAILLKTPQGKFILVDGGGSQFYDAGSRTILPYLHRRGIRELCMLINTHPDNDHLGGLQTVAAEMGAEYMGLPGNVYNCPEYKTLKDIAAQQNIKLMPLLAGQTINIEEGLEIKVLHPGKEVIDPDNFNNDSVVLRMRYGDFSLLLTGDIGKEAMEAIMKRYALDRTTVVKIPHHGSKTSLLAAFYQATQAHYGIISVGSNNLFGHPHPGVLDMLNKAQIKTLRTDQLGAITVMSNGRNLRINAMRD